MISILLRAFLLSLDSLVVSFALGPMIRTGRQRCAWAALFGLCDALAAALGPVVGRRFWSGAFSEVSAPLLVLAFGVYCLVAAGWNKFRADPRLALGLPVLMSLDNLAYGAGAGPLSHSFAARVAWPGLVSFAFALLGMALGGAVRSTEPRRTERRAAFALIGASVFLACW